MTCLESQSNIMNFVEKKLPDDRVADFVRHMKHCSNCYEEMEIYYTLIVGMKQLDEGDKQSTDFAEDMKNELKRLENRARNVKRFKLSTFGIVCSIAIVIMFGFYMRALVSAYNIEQMRIKHSQGEHYFYDSYSDLIVLCDRDVIEEASVVPEVHTESFYEKVHIYNLVHRNDDMEDEDEDIID